MYYLQITIIVAINCLLALGAYLPLSTGLMVLCFGALMSVGAIVSAAIYSSTSIPFPVAIFLGGIVSGMGGATVAYVCKRLSGFMLAVATLGLGELARVIALNAENLGGALGFKNVKLVTVTFNLLWLLVALAVCLIFFFFFERSQMHKAFTLIRENEMLASSLGINVSQHKVISVSCGGFLAGVAGGFYIHSIGLLEPKLYGFEQSLLILMYPIFGGGRNFIGPLIGASALTMIPEVFRFSLSLRMTLYGLILLLIVVFRPGGIIRSRSFY